MKKISVMLSVIIFTIVFTVNLLPAETGGQAGQTAVNVSGAENITDEEMGWPNKYNMKLKKYGIFGKRFKFRIYYESYNYDDIDFQNIISLTNEYTIKLYNRVKSLSILDRLKSKSIELYQKVVQSYNSFINSGTLETIRLKNYFKQKFIMKKKALESESLQHSKITHFIGLKSIIGTEMGVGLKFGLLFPVYEQFKIGFWLEFIYTRDFSIDPDIADITSFHGGSIQFGMKIDWFYFAGGFYYYKRHSDEYLGGSINGESDMLRVQKSIYGFKFSLGYFYDKKFKFFIGMEISFDLKKSYQKYVYSGTGYIPEGMGYGRTEFGLEIGIGF